MSDELLGRLDPELRGPVREMMGEFVTLDDIPAARAAERAMMGPGPGATPGPTQAQMSSQMSALHPVEVEDRVIPGPPGAPDVAVRVYRPEGREGVLPALLWMHGGGYVLGSIDFEEPVSARLAVEGDCVTVAVEYRLAPEDPFPAALEDCYAALRWMVSDADELGIDRSRVAIGGASAGGGLAAGLALLARDRGGIDVVFELLVYPMLDDCTTDRTAGCTTASATEAPPDAISGGLSAAAVDAPPDALFWTRAHNLVGWRSYLGHEPGGEGVSCYASACRATDLAGLPPTYIAVGDQDLFAAEDIDYARRLIGAAVHTELHVYPGGCHGFDMIVPDALISRRLTSDVSRALQQALQQDR